MQRGNNRMPLFLNDDDFANCIALLRETSQREECVIHSYALMGNHWHLLATPLRRNSAARLMQSVGFRYARYFNFRYERTGAVFEGRYRSTVITSERYFFACSRYIELNPVRALIANHPGEYKWSSFGSNGGTEFDPLVVAHPLYNALGDTVTQRRSAYLALFDVAIDSDIINAIRDATNSGGDVTKISSADGVKKNRKWTIAPTQRGGEIRGTKFQSVASNTVARL
ncbi:MAG: transposase [Gemmatimonadaceae bacterium]